MVSLSKCLTLYRLATKQLQTPSLHHQNMAKALPPPDPTPFLEPQPRSRRKLNLLALPITSPMPSSVPPQQPQAPIPDAFPFLLLPAELRNQIYRLLLCTSSPIPLLHPMTSPGSLSASLWLPELALSETSLPRSSCVLFLVCHLIYKEASHVFYTLNKFLLSPASIPSSLEATFGATALTTHLRLIRRWHIDVDINKFTFKENLHGSLSLQKFWQGQCPKGVVVEVHLRLSRENLKTTEVRSVVEIAMDWWGRMIVPGHIPLNVFFHHERNCGNLWELMRGLPFRLLRCEGGEDWGSWGPVWYWVWVRGERCGKGEEVEEVQSRSGGFVLPAIRDTLMGEE
jgi:hypothetical protein